MIYDLAGLCARRLFERPDLGVIHRHLRGFAPAAVISRKHRRLAAGALGDNIAVADYHHMGAGDLLRVKPRIILGGGLKGQNVVLDIVPAHKDGVAVVGDILKRGEGLYFFCLVVFRPLQIALTVKLVADLRKFRVAVGAVDRVDNAFKVGKLLPALLDKLTEQLFRILRLAVFLKIFLGVR